MPNVEPACAGVNGWPGCTWFVPVPSALGSVAGGLAKLSRVEQVEDLPPELDVRASHRTRSACETSRSTCLKPGPRSDAALHVAEGAGRRDGERRGVQPLQAVLRGTGSTPGTRSGRRTLRDAPPPGVLMTAMQRRRRARAAGARPCRGRRRRAASPGRRCGRPLRALTIAPTSQPPSNACATPLTSRRQLPAAAERQRVQRADVEGVPHVERVVADVVVEIVERDARCWPPSALRSSRRCCRSSAPACTASSSSARC